MSDEIVLPDGEAFYLHPGERWRWPSPFESVTLPPDLVGWLDGCSAGASGTDGACDGAPYRSRLVGRIVLEFYNSGVAAACPGMLIGALSLSRCPAGGAAL